jgi:hypothetical protein
LCRDNTPSILLCEWEVESDYLEDESLDIEEAAKVAKKPRLGDAEFLFKDWNLERLFETSVPTSAYTGEWCLLKYKFLKSSLIMYIHQRINLIIQAGVTKHEPAVWLLLAQPAVR